MSLHYPQSDFGTHNWLVLYVYIHLTASKLSDQVNLLPTVELLQNTSD